MSTILRRVKEATHVPSTPPVAHANNDLLSQRDSSQPYTSPALKYSNGPSSVDFSAAGDSPYNLDTHQPLKHPKYTSQNPFVDIRSRLARKGTVFSLKGRGKGKQTQVYQPRKTKNEALSPLNKELPPPPSSSTCSSPFAQNRQRATPQWDIDSSTSTVILSGDRPVTHSAPLDLFPSPPKSKQGIDFLRPAKAPANSPITLHSAFPSLQDTIRLKQRLLVQEGYIQRSHNNDHMSSTMAAENAAPPLPYARLQELTIHACEQALANVTNYHHPSTEGWNTTIINTILGNLVSETTPGASAKSVSPQPQFKYVVNSTIIQHAPTSAGAPPDAAVTGRRGMHAASGAYWNNDTDGMWSYKYSAPKSKGLDVVVGIIWVWVG